MNFNTHHLSHCSLQQLQQSNPQDPALIGQHRVTEYRVRVRDRVRDRGRRKCFVLYFALDTTIQLTELKLHELKSQLSSGGTSTSCPVTNTS